MSDFESDLINSVKCALTKQITGTDFIAINYNDRMKLPEDFINRAWKLVDQERLLTKLAERLELELVDRLVNQIAAELATDIKQVLSVKERREEVRNLVRENINRLTRAKDS